MDPALTNFFDSLRRARIVPESAVDELAQIVQEPMSWQFATDTDPEEAASHGRAFYEAHQGDWHFGLADFPIDDQPGYQPGDRGQNVGIRNSALAVTLLGDDAVFHHFAAWLLERHVRTNLDLFVGGGSEVKVRVVYVEQTAQKYNIDSPATLEAGIAWLEGQIAAVGTTTWAVPITGSFYRFDQPSKTAYYWGNPHGATNYLLQAMGWNVLCIAPCS